MVFESEEFTVYPSIFQECTGTYSDISFANEYHALDGYLGLIGPQLTSYGWEKANWDPTNEQIEDMELKSDAVSEHLETSLNDNDSGYCCNEVLQLSPISDGSDRSNETEHFNDLSSEENSDTSLLVNASPSDNVMSDYASDFCSSGESDDDVEVDVDSAAEFEDEDEQFEVLEDGSCEDLQMVVEPFVYVAPSTESSAETNVQVADVTRVICYEQDHLKRSRFLSGRQLQRITTANATSQSQNAPLNARTREIVVDWLIQVQNYCGFEVESLYTGITMFDIYNAEQLPDVETIQLVAITCILLATKLHEEDHVDIKQLIHLTEDSYTKDQVLTMERHVIKFFGYRLDFATPYNFKILYEDKPVFIKYLADYLLELAMKEVFYTQYTAQELVESCVWAAIIVHTQGLDPTRRSHVSDSHPLGAPIKLILQTLLKSKTDLRTGAKEKYSSDKFHAISKHPSVVQFNYYETARDRLHD